MSETPRTCCHGDTEWTAAHYSQPEWVLCCDLAAERARADAAEARVTAQDELIRDQQAARERTTTAYALLKADRDRLASKLARLDDVDGLAEAIIGAECIGDDHHKLCQAAAVRKFVEGK